MNGRRALLLSALITVAAFGLVPDTAAGVANPNDPCTGAEATEVRLYLDSEERVGSKEAILYPGTTLTMYVCSDGDPEPYGSAWGFDGSSLPGIENVRTGDVKVVFTLSTNAEETSPARGITKKGDLDGPTIRIQRGYRAESRVANVTLQFRSADARDRYEQAEATWAQNTSALENATGTLRQLAASEQVLSTSPTAALGTIRDTNLAATRSDLQRAAFEATVADDTADAGRVVTASDERATKLRQNSRDALKTYINAVKSQKSEAVRDVRIVTGVTLIGGLLAGLGLGYVLARRTLRKVEFDRGVSTASQYSLTHITVPLALGILSLGVALVGAVLGGVVLFKVIL